MHRLGLSSALVALALAPLSGIGQQALRRGRDGWTRTFSGTLPAASRLRVNGHGPVTVEGGVGTSCSYTVTLTAAVRSEAEASRILQRAPLQVTTQGDTIVLTAPGGAVMARVVVQAPRLAAVSIGTSDGTVEAHGIDGSLDVNSRAGEIAVDRVRGRCTLSTGGGNMRVGTVDGPLMCTTGGGSITVKLARGDARLETYGGDIVADQVDGELRAQTAGGGVHVRMAGGTVTAATGGGEIVIEKAKGIVTARNMAGPVQVGSAAGVQCENASGGVRLSRIEGPMRVSTSMGNIVADLAGTHFAPSYLATASGDITVMIPSNLRVTVRAENGMADTMRRIISDFPAIASRRQGSRVVAQGAVNGGGPLLQISDTGGTIFIRKR
jgi:DUF4097 and DUF4098 domain-containing protein YvlB